MLSLWAFCLLAGAPVFSQSFVAPGVSEPAAPYSLAEGTQLYDEVGGFISVFPENAQADPQSAFDSLAGAYRSETSPQRKAALEDVLQSLVGDPSASVERLAEAGIKRALWDKIQTRRQFLLKAARSRPHLKEAITSLTRELPGSAVAEAEPAPAPKPAPTPRRLLQIASALVAEPAAPVTAEPADVAVNALAEAPADPVGSKIPVAETAEPVAPRREQALEIAALIKDWRFRTTSGESYSSQAPKMLETYAILARDALRSRHPSLTPEAVRELRSELSRTAQAIHLPNLTRDFYARVLRQLDAAYPAANVVESPPANVVALATKARPVRWRWSLVSIGTSAGLFALALTKAAAAGPLSAILEILGACILSIPVLQIFDRLLRPMLRQPEEPSPVLPSQKPAPTLQSVKPNRSAETPVARSIPIRPEKKMNQVSVGPDGQIWGLEHGTNRISRFDPLSSSWKVYPSKLNEIAVGPEGQVWGLEYGGGRVYQFNEGKLSWEGSDTRLHHLSVGSTGEVWGLEYGSKKVLRFYPDSSSWETSETRLNQIAAGPHGLAWGLEYGTNKFSKYDTAAGEWITEDKKLNQIAVGPNGELWGLEYGTHRVCRYDFASSNWEIFPIKMNQLVVGPNGDVWGLDYGSNRFAKLELSFVSRP